LFLLLLLLLLGADVGVATGADETDIAVYMGGGIEISLCSDLELSSGFLFVLKTMTRAIIAPRRVPIMVTPIQMIFFRP
jgi:hypothetical protein